MDVLDRYSRQAELPGIGPEGQEKLGRSRILCVGAGAQASAALLYLAGSGAGTIGIADTGVVDTGQLHAEVLYSERDHGQSRISAAKNRLLALNSEITVNVYREELTEKNVTGLFSSYDVVLDCTNNLPSSYFINEAAVRLGKPVIFGAASGFQGKVSVFNMGNGEACCRCLNPQSPAGGTVAGALTGIIGATQAMEAIKIIIDHESFRTLAGCLWEIDVRTMETHVTVIEKNKPCPVCARSPAAVVPQYSSPVCAAGVTEINCAEAAAMDAVWIDVREREEWDAGHIEGAVLLPLSALRGNPELYEAQQKGRPCILYCQRGRRSMMAAEILRQAGFTGLYSMAGGYEAWCACRN